MLEPVLPSAVDAQAHTTAAAGHPQRTGRRTGRRVPIFQPHTKIIFFAPPAEHRIFGQSYAPLHLLQMLLLPFPRIQGQKQIPPPPMAVAEHLPGDDILQIVVGCRGLYGILPVEQVQFTVISFAVFAFEQRKVAARSVTTKRYRP